jgi:carbon storage regulator
LLNGTLVAQEIPSARKLEQFWQLWSLFSKYGDPYTSRNGKPNNPSRRTFEMLVLSRKEGEKLVIGDNITLVVTKISGNRITLGIEAPADVKIMRGELKETEKFPRVVPMRRAATMTIDLDEFENIALDKNAM